MAVDGDDNIVVTGDFTNAGGTTGANHLARFDKDGKPDTDFNEEVADTGKLNSSVHSVALAGDDKIVVAGNFTNAGGTAGANHLAQFDSEGKLDTDFNDEVAANGGPNHDVRSVAVAGDGKIVVTGVFTNAGGTDPVNRLARFESDGSPDTAFNTVVKSEGGINNIGYSLAVAGDGKIVVAGEFTDAGGTTGANHLARFKNDGTPDEEFNEAVATEDGLNDWGYSVVLDGDGKIVVAGAFTTAGGTTGVNHLARFNGDPLAPTPTPTPPTPTPPAPTMKKPRKVVALKVSGKPASSKRTISWKRPSTAGNHPVQRYRLEVRQTGRKKVIIKATVRNTGKIARYTLTRKRLLRAVGLQTRGEHRPKQIRFTVSVRAWNQVAYGTISTKRLVVKT